MPNKKAQLNNIAEFEKAFASHKDLVYGFVFRLTNDRPAADDITQTTFVKLWKNFNSMDQSKNMKSWILTIARNTAYDWFRKRRHVPLSTFDSEESDESFANMIESDGPATEVLAIQNEAAETIEKVLSILDPAHKEIVLLHTTGELTFEEISLVVSRPLNTVKSQYLRALKKMREKLLASQNADAPNP